MKEKYDYIICGAGLSGLILASRIFEDRFFDDKNILLIDKDLKSSVNKTWCFGKQETLYGKIILSNHGIL